jgi:AraC-like DNA-binding protein
MPQSHIFTLTDPDSYEAAIRAGTYEVFVTSKGDFHAELTRIDLQRLWMQQSDTNLAWLMNFSNAPQRAAMLFLTDADQAPIREGGTEVLPGQILIFERRAANRCWTSGPNRLATMSLTHADLAAAGEAILGRELTAPRNTYTTRPPSAAMARLTALHKAAGELAKTAPDTLAHPAVANALEQELIHAMVACMTANAEPTPYRGSHARVIARFEEFLAERQFQPVYLAEMCADLAVSERTLRACCHEHLGVGPMRYLWLRRMHLARRALLQAESKVVSVTEIATEYGFWELGRFSVEYRSLFGESPSASLHRPAQRSFDRSLSS